MTDIQWTDDEYGVVLHRLDDRRVGVAALVSQELLHALAPHIGRRITEANAAGFEAGYRAAMHDHAVNGGFDLRRRHHAEDTP